MSRLVSVFAVLVPLTIYLQILIALLAVPPTAGWSLAEINYTEWRRNHTTNSTRANLTTPTKDVCGLTRWNRDTWNQSGIDQWLRTQLAEYRKDPTPENDFVKGFLQPAFAPGASSTLADCIVEHECEVGLIVTRSFSTACLHHIS